MKIRKQQREIALQKRLENNAYTDAHSSIPSEEKIPTGHVLEMVDEIEKNTKESMATVDRWNVDKHMHDHEKLSMRLKKLHHK